MSREESNKKWRLKNKEYHRERYLKNKEKILKQCAEYRLNNREKRSEIGKEYYLKNKELLKEQRRTRYLKNREKTNKQTKEYYLNHTEQYRELRIKNREYNNEWRKDYKSKNINFRIACNLRNRQYQSLKRKQKTGSAVKDLGCTIPYLKKYLEKQFAGDMTWDNYGKWHIDHIKPLVLFDLEDREQYLKAVHYTNLQPLWAKDNFSKRTKYPYELNAKHTQPSLV